MADQPTPSGSSETLAVSRQDGVATLTLNRPERLNALGADLREALLAALQALATDAAVRCVVLTGAGRAFCSGGDVKEMAERRQSDSPVRPEAGQTPLRDRILLQMRAMPQPVIAAVNGVAVGAGMNLALACDLRIASERAVFGEVFVKRGLHPDWGGTWLLPRLVGPAKAAELIFSGDLIDAAEALRLGIVNRVVPHEGFAQAAADWAAQLAAGPTVAIGLAKRGIYRALGSDLQSALEYESYAQQTAWDTRDAAEGVRAFVEKREPRFRGR